jgi:hypothetical protein
MSLENDITDFFRSINGKITNGKYNYEDIRKTRILLRIELAYMLYIMKNKLNLNSDTLVISHHKKIICDYIILLKNYISKKIINSNPELYYLILAYFRILEKDNKILLQKKSKFISVYIDSIKNNKQLNTSLNILLLSMELANNIKTIFKHDVYEIENEFTYVKNIISIILENYSDLQTNSENNSSDSNSENNSSDSNSENNSSDSNSEHESDNYFNDNSNILSIKEKSNFKYIKKNVKPKNI